MKRIKTFEALEGALVVGSEGSKRQECARLCIEELAGAAIENAQEIERLYKKPAPPPEQPERGRGGIVRRVKKAVYKKKAQVLPENVELRELFAEIYALPEDKRTSEFWYRKAYFYLMLGSDYLFPKDEANRRSLPEVGFLSDEVKVEALKFPDGSVEDIKDSQLLSNYYTNLNAAYKSGKLKYDQKLTKRYVEHFLGTDMKYPGFIGRNVLIGMQVVQAGNFMLQALDASNVAYTLDFEKEGDVVSALNTRELLTNNNCKSLKEYPELLKISDIRSNVDEYLKQPENSADLIDVVEHFIGKPREEWALRRLDNAKYLEGLEHFEKLKEIIGAFIKTDNAKDVLDKLPISQEKLATVLLGMSDDSSELLRYAKILGELDKVIAMTSVYAKALQLNAEQDTDLNKKCDEGNAPKLLDALKDEYKQYSKKLLKQKGRERSWEAEDVSYIGKMEKILLHILQRYDIENRVEEMWGLLRSHHDSARAMLATDETIKAAVIGYFVKTNQHDKLFYLYSLLSNVDEMKNALLEIRDKEQIRGLVQVSDDFALFILGDERSMSAVVDGYKQAKQFAEFMKPLNVQAAQLLLNHILQRDNGVKIVVQVLLHDDAAYLKEHTELLLDETIRTSVSGYLKERDHFGELMDLLDKVCEIENYEDEEDEDEEEDIPDIDDVAAETNNEKEQIGNISKILEPILNALLLDDELLIPACKGAILVKDGEEMQSTRSRSGKQLLWYAKLLNECGGEYRDVAIELYLAAITKDKKQNDPLFELTLNINLNMLSKEQRSTYIEAQLGDKLLQLHESEGVNQEIKGTILQRIRELAQLDQGEVVFGDDIFDARVALYKVLNPHYPCGQFIANNIVERAFISGAEFYRASSAGLLSLKEVKRQFSSHGQVFISNIVNTTKLDYLVNDFLSGSSKYIGEQDGGVECVINSLVYLIGAKETVDMVDKWLRGGENKTEQEFVDKKIIFVETEARKDIKEDYVESPKMLFDIALALWKAADGKLTVESTNMILDMFPVEPVMEAVKQQGAVFYKKTENVETNASIRSRFIHAYLAVNAEKAKEIAGQNPDLCKQAVAELIFNDVYVDVAGYLESKNTMTLAPTSVIAKDLITENNPKAIGDILNAMNEGGVSAQDVLDVITEKHSGYKKPQWLVDVVDTQLESSFVMVD